MDICLFFLLIYETQVGLTSDCALSVNVNGYFKLTLAEGNDQVLVGASRPFLKSVGQFDHILCKVYIIRHGEMLHKIFRR